MKKVILSVFGVLELICLICIYVIGGMQGVYAWNINLFVLSPIALIIAIASIVVLIVKLFKKKIIKIDIIFTIIFIILSYPITIWLGISNITYPENVKSSDEILVTMPVKDPVLFGGKDFKSHAVWPSECYAYDILSEPHNIGSSRLEDYGVYNSDVIAPVSGEVIGVESSEEDIEPNTEEYKSRLGNYIFIKIDNTDTYMIMAHFKNQSIVVSEGDHVEEGEFIGKVGNSGTTSEPHLHIQQQRNNPNEMIFPTVAEGLPIKFK